MAKYADESVNAQLEAAWGEASGLTDGLKGKMLHKVGGYKDLKPFKECGLPTRANWYKAGEDGAKAPGKDVPTGVKKYSVSWVNGPDIDGRAPFVTSSQAGFIAIVDAYSGMVMRPMAKLKYVMEAAISPDMKAIVAGGMDNSLTLYNTSAEAVNKFLPKKATMGDPDENDFAAHDGYISAITFVDNTKILSASGDSKVKLWDISTQEVISTFRGHIADCTGVCRDADDPNIFGTSSTDKSVRVWDTRVPVAVRKFVAKYSTNCCTMLPGSKVIAAGCDNASWEVYDVGSAQQAARGKVKKGRCESIASSKSGRCLYLGWDNFQTGLVQADTFAPDNQAKIFDPQCGSGEKAHGDECVKSLSMSYDGHGLLSAGFDGLVKLWTKMPAP